MFFCLTLQGEITTGDAAAVDNNDGGEGQDGDKNGVVVGTTRKASSLASTDLSVFNSPAAASEEQHTVNDDDIINAVDAKNTGKVFILHHKAFFFILTNLKMMD